MPGNLGSGMEIVVATVQRHPRAGVEDELHRRGHGSDLAEACKMPGIGSQILRSAGEAANQITRLVQRRDDGRA